MLHVRAMTKFDNLKNMLEDRGWLVNQVESFARDWQSYLVWQLDSVWSPVGLRRFVHFSIDPMVSIQPDETQRTEKNVWQIIVTKKQLTFHHVDPETDCICEVGVRRLERSQAIILAKLEEDRLQAVSQV